MKSLTLLATLAIAALMPGVSAAQSWGHTPRGGHSPHGFSRVAETTIVCESIEGRYTTCAVGGSVTQVQLLNQYSRSGCIGGQTYGISGRDVWVSNGCRGQFRVTIADDFGGRGDRGRGRDWDRERADRIICASTNRRYNTCVIPFGAEVRLGSQQSSAACIEGQTWGYLDDVVWVNGGCRAEFLIFPRRGRQPDVQRVTCESPAGRYTTCFLGRGFNTVVLERQLSRSGCIEGSTFGFDRGYVWVDRGCRGVFRGAGGRRAFDYDDGYSSWRRD